MCQRSHQLCHFCKISQNVIILRGTGVKQTFQGCPMIHEAFKKRIKRRAIPLLAALFASILLLSCGKAAASEPPAASGADPQPSVVRTGIYVLNVGRLDTLTSTYTSDFFLSFKCDQPCQPDNFEFTNGRATSVDKQDDFPNEKLYRLQASFSTDVSFKSYPFDTHKLLISMEDKQLTREEQVYQMDTSLNGIDSEVIVAGWELAGWDATVTEHYYPVFDQTYSRYEFFINIRRSIVSAILKALVPGLAIVVGGFLAFLLGPDKRVQRLTINSAALTGAILFHVNLTSQVPPVGSLTFADKFMLVNYVGLVGALGSTVTMLILSDKKQEALVQRIHLRSRLWIPISWIVLQAAVAVTI